LAQGPEEKFAQFGRVAGFVIFNSFLPEGPRSVGGSWPAAGSKGEVGFAQPDFTNAAERRAAALGKRHNSPVM
jgi:hypothetical protein